MYLIVQSCINKGYYYYYASAYTETKKFSNTLQIRIFITEIHVEITQTE